MNIRQFAMINEQSFVPASLLLLLILSFSFVTPTHAATLFTENFDGATTPNLPSGWSTATVSGSCFYNWYTRVGTHVPSGQLSHSSPNLAYFNSFSCLAGYSSLLYRTTGIDLTGIVAPTVSFWMYHETGYPSAADRVQLQVSTDSGATWENVGTPVYRYDGSTGWAQYNIDISAYVGQSDVRIAFLGIGDYGNDCHIDDIEVNSQDTQLTCDLTLCYEIVATDQNGNTQDDTWEVCLNNNGHGSLFSFNAAASYELYLFGGGPGWFNTNGYPGFVNGDPKWATWIARGINESGFLQPIGDGYLLTGEGVHNGNKYTVQGKRVPCIHADPM
jgi:hypothetical protein